MKKLILLCAITLCVTIAHAGAWTWASSLISTGMVRAWDLGGSSLNPAIWVGGQYDGSMSFNGIDYPSAGMSDAFVAKYSREGTPLWFRQFGSPDEDVCLSIEAGTGGTDNCYLTGYFNDVMSVGSTVLTSAGMWDVFLGKLSPGGDVLWLKRFGGTLNDIGYGITVDHEDNVIVAGWFADTIDFGGGISISSYGGSDMFVAKFDPQGTCLWAKHAGDEGVDYGYKVDCSETGYIYVTGVAGQGANFDGISQSQDGLFVAKYSYDGSIMWVSSALGAGPINIGIGKQDLLQYRGMVTGRVTGTAVFGDHVISSVDGSDDIFLAEFSPGNGTWINVQRWGGTGSDKGRAVDVHDYMGSLTVASYENSVDFGSSILNSNGVWDCALLKGGPQAAAVGFGSINTDVVSDVKRALMNKAITCGWYNGSMRLGNILLNSGSDAIQSGFIGMYDFDAVATDDPILPPPVGLSCYPNPFSSNLEISSKDKTISKLQVFNQRGQLVRDLEHSSPNTWRWDGQDSQGNLCATGIYLIRSAELRSFQKVLLLR
ncbi:MAG TPA: hypothetical protein PLO35_01780 [Candidatus Cloacimonadota bacterium]|nr:hypothetical protein [Candidatus Cloacimonadota bacterium]